MTPIDYQEPSDSLAQQARKIVEQTNRLNFNMVNPTHQMTSMISQLFAHADPPHPMNQPYLDFISTLAELSALSKKSE
jgi:hypothetical protein